LKTDAPPRTREVWYKGDIAIQFINPHTGRWATKSLRPALPHESEKTMTTDTPHLSGSHNTHARLAPSNSKSWSSCTAGPAFLVANSHRVPKNNDTVFSSEGTVCHDWATKYLLNEIQLGEVPEFFRPYVESYASHCLSLVPEGESYLVEQQTKLFYQPDKTGTLDFGFVSDDLVVIADLKFGQGVLVQAEGNTQLLTYALSLVSEWEDVLNFHPATEVRMSIFQPRHREAGNAKPWVVTLADLTELGKDLEYRSIQARTAIERVQAKLPCGERDISPAELLEAAPMVVFKPSDGDDGACRFCPAKGFCPKRLEAATADLDLPQLSVEDMLAEMPDLDKKESKEPVADRLALVTSKLGMEPLPDSYLVTLVRQRKAIESFLADASEYLEARLLDGEQIEGLKVVMGREGNRAWGNEDDADKWLKGQGLKEADRYDYKLKSPTKIEEALKEKLSKTTRTRNRFDELVSRSPARKVMALADDKRPAVSCDLDAMPDMGADDDFEV
jgi:hypothetical protein